MNDDIETATVRKAFAKAYAAGETSPVCYTAAVDALVPFYPEANRAFVAHRAVAILTGGVSLLAISEGRASRPG